MGTNNMHKPAVEAPAAATGGADNPWLEAQYEYKCRRCGEIKHSLCSNAAIAWQKLVHTVIGLEEGFGKDVRLLDVHTCKDGGEGIADLIGYRLVDTMVGPETTTDDV